MCLIIIDARCNLKIVKYEFIILMCLGVSRDTYFCDRITVSSNIKGIYDIFKQKRLCKDNYSEGTRYIRDKSPKNATTSLLELSARPSSHQNQR